jgi:hypothetical protein
MVWLVAELLLFYYYYFSLDSNHDCVSVVIRGTLSLEDAFTDVMCHPQEVSKPLAVCRPSLSVSAPIPPGPPFGPSSVPSLHLTSETDTND